MSAMLFPPLFPRRPAVTGAVPTHRIDGIPSPLPQGETIVWQGKPTWWSLAQRLCHIRGVAVYFAVVACGMAALALLHGSTALEVALSMTPVFVAAAISFGFLLGMAWLIARSTQYTLTTGRVVIRSGIALHAVLVIPFNAIAQAAVTLQPDQTGDLPLTLKPGHRVALHNLWPHSRPWRISHPEPMLRSVPRAGHVASLLATALAEAQRAALASPAASLSRTAIDVAKR